MWKLFNRYKKKCVYCRGCAHLTVIKFPDEESPAAMCLAEASFKSGPYRDAIDLEGMDSAGLRNLNNNCSYRARRSSLSSRMKKWILETGMGLIDIVPLDAIDLSKEKRLVEDLIKSRKPKELQNAEVITKEAYYKEKAAEARSEAEVKESRPTSRRIRRRPTSKTLADIKPIAEAKQIQTQLEDTEFYKRVMQGKE